MLPDNLPKVLMKDMGLISRAVSTAAAAAFLSLSISTAPSFYVWVSFFMTVCVCVP